MPDGGGKGGFSEMMYKPTCHRIVTFLEILVWLNRGRRKSTCFQRFAFFKNVFHKNWI